jgi:hypothetical protein
MAFFKILDEIARFQADDRGRTGAAGLGAAWAVVMCLGVVALWVLCGCTDPDPFKGF